MSDMNEVVQAWSSFILDIDDWESLVSDADPRAGGCGLVYELPNPIERPNESFTIADMRQLDLSDPHKHINGETEIYFVLQGVGRIALGNNIHELMLRGGIVIPPDTVHITLPKRNLVLAVVNTPPFNLDNYVSVSTEDPDVSAVITELRT